MKFNKFIWENYIHSPEGKRWKSFFSRLEEAYRNQDRETDQFLKSINRFYEGSDFREEIIGVLDALKELRDTVKEGVISETIASRQEASVYWEDISYLVTDDESEDIFYLDDIPRLSVALYCLHPKFFFPYYFYLNFHSLRKIFDEFGIFLPPVPPKSDTEARYNYYWELCQSLHDFWSKLELPTDEVPVFLYGFAPQVLDFNKPTLEALPPPKRAWFIGGGINNNGDFSYLDKVTSSSTTYWQGNRDTEIGDIVVMYCLSPRSYVHSIWRAIEPGSVEPFFAFYGTIRIGYPLLLEHVTFSEMKGDSLLSTMPLVKGSMQGINGRNIPKEFFDQLLSILSNKGMDLNKIPRLENREWQDNKIKTERDVEINLLEPLLIELGFSEDDWSRQIKLRVGRAEKAIPDYLLHVSKDSQTKSVRASWVWEAKLSIATNEQLAKDFGQVCSYAMLVNAEGISLISREGIWIAFRKDNYNLSKARHWSFSQMKERDHINEIRELVGKKSLKRTHGS